MKENIFYLFTFRNRYNLNDKINTNDKINQILRGVVLCKVILEKWAIKQKFKK